MPLFDGNQLNFKAILLFQFVVKTTGAVKLAECVPNSRVQNATMSSRNISASPGRLPILAPLRP
jgi:hypothetical protein